MGSETSGALKTAAWLAVGLVLFVVVLGAWVRLSHAGLGCPDWPGCYGEITWPDTATEIDAANAAYPDRPVSQTKAFKEMLHRYVAGTLMLLVYGIAWARWRKRREDPTGARLAAGIAALITLQALFGMWTVTLKLMPLVVTAHLLGGMATFSLLLWQALRLTSRAPPSENRWRGPLLVGLALLVAQISLGGWTSSNYAALACADFPTCGGEWWPDTAFTEGFELRREVGVDYEGGVLDYPARVAIHLAHRIGAVIVSGYLLLLAVLLALSKYRLAGGLLLVALGTQVALGIANVVYSLPLAVAAAHNGGAAFLLGVLVLLLAGSRTPIMRR
ncbi:MAG: COX15/CtaA family protein [Pseudomonadota bacterium]